MKTITIGRGEGANIIIDDDRVSRRHAILKIYNSGKIEIVDLSKNGTFVNGVKLKQNVPCPVRRKDVVNFADASQLDWSQIPNVAKFYKIALIVIVAVLIFVMGFTLFKGCDKAEESLPKYNDIEETVVEQNKGNTFKKVKEDKKENKVTSLEELFPDDSGVSEPVNKTKKKESKEKEQKKEKSNDNLEEENNKKGTDKKSESVLYDIF